MSKQELMNTIVAEIKVCRKCELWKHRRNVVPGEGNFNAKVMFVGEAPGYWEDMKGRPFVGAAGKLLDKLLSKIWLSRNDVYIANVLKCRPPENRDPLTSELNACTPFLDRQIKLIKPKIIVPLGRHATSYILSKAGFKAGGITKLHGKTWNITLLGLQAVVLPTYHPAAALYNPKYVEELERDFRTLKNELGKL
ncbi:MAG: type-4 uracil-DNA glycosylase [Thermoproteota archaeon]|nr:type-4 uracil-DNA glycosylase [Thermoproteota archaeon]